MKKCKRILTLIVMLTLLWSASANAGSWTLAFPTGVSSMHLSDGSVVYPDANGQVTVTNTQYVRELQASGFLMVSFSHEHPFSGITSGTNSKASLEITGGASLSYAGAGIINANQYKGNASPTAAQFGYLDPISSIQEQFNSKSKLSGGNSLTGNQEISGDLDVTGTINKLTLGTSPTGFEISGGTTPKKLKVLADAEISGNNTGDQDLSGLVPYTGATGDVDLEIYDLYVDAVHARTITGVVDTDLDIMVFGTGVMTFFSDFGSYYFRNDDSMSHGILDFAGLTNPDKTFTFPDLSGTIALTSDVGSGEPEEMYLIRSGGVIKATNQNSGSFVSSQLASGYLLGRTTAGTGDVEAIPLVTTLANPGSHTNVPTEAAVAAAIAGFGSGTVTTLSVASSNGIEGTVANATTTPEISLILKDITPASVNGVPAATMAYVDPTSSIQGQFNAKANLDGGNTWTGDQDFGSGNLVTSGTISGKIKTETTNSTNWTPSIAVFYGGVAVMTAGGTCNFPIASVGMSVTTISGSTAIMHVVINGSDTIVLDGTTQTVGHGIKNPGSAAEEYITFYCREPNIWHTIGNPKAWVENGG